MSVPEGRIDTYQWTEKSSVIGYLLALSLILGALILAVGISGIAVTQKLSKQVEKISDTAFGPALAFDEIINALKGIEIHLLKAQRPQISNSDKALYFMNMRNLLDRIQIIESEQLLKSENQDYGEYLLIRYYTKHGNWADAPGLNLRLGEEPLSL